MILISYWTANKFKTLLSADCQKMFQYDIPHLRWKCCLLDMKSIKEAKGRSLKAYAVDGPSGVKLSFSEGLDEDSQRGLIAIMIMRRLFHAQMLVKGIILIGMAQAL